MVVAAQPQTSAATHIRFNWGFVLYCAVLGQKACISAKANVQQVRKDSARVVMIEPISSITEQDFQHEVARRRTFAIISSDAGKTTLTEKLLLYADQSSRPVQCEHGAANARSSQIGWLSSRNAVFPFPTVQVEHAGCLFNILDTPGHQDFSEDTYRTLMAVNSAIMVLDSAKGIEAQGASCLTYAANNISPSLPLSTSWTSRAATHWNSWTKSKIYWRPRRR